MRYEAITWGRMAGRLAKHVDRLAPGDGGEWLKVAVDGAPDAGGEELAGLLAEQFQDRGRPVRVIGTRGFLRPASLRYEHGRQDPDAYYGGWTDIGALWREVFTPLEPGGDGRILPDLWDPVRDRATRSPYVTLPPGGVLVLHGPFLLGHWFPFDLTVHLRLSAAALARRTGETWALPAFARYETEVDPVGTADVVVRADDPRHPAWTGLGALGSD
ncbi:uridine kinase [Streptomyces sp. NPDC014773]|uniref:uridine kinase n=1 Tax=Streptomyces sp. NPDC014773 TaxID=3364908 RepID=UPI00370206D2